MKAKGYFIIRSVLGLEISFSAVIASLTTPYIKHENIKASWWTEIQKEKEHVPFRGLLISRDPSGEVIEKIFTDLFLNTFLGLTSLRNNIGDLLFHVMSPNSVIIRSKPKIT